MMLHSAQKKKKKKKKEGGGRGNVEKGGQELLDILVCI